MSNHIDKDDEKRWFYVQNNGSGEQSVIVFGNSGERYVTELLTGEPILQTYLTEQELELAVNTIANDSEYYQNCVETESEKFVAPSTIYTYGLKNL